MFFWWSGYNSRAVIASVRTVYVIYNTKVCTDKQINNTHTYIIKYFDRSFSLLSPANIQDARNLFINTENILHMS